MSVQREFLAGDTDRFAFKMAFQRDPNGAEAATPEHALSWGSFQLWVNGQNLCAHLEEGETMVSVHWYMLPLLEWLVASWDFLLHEERLPVRNAGADAWSSLVATAFPPPGLAEDRAEAWAIAWHAWWARHCLLACREGGLYPDVYIRRWQELIEISWGPLRIAGQPTHYRFLAGRGYTRCHPREVAEALYNVIRQASDYLLSRMPASVRLQQLHCDVQSLQMSRTETRLALLAGLGGDLAQAKQRWQDVQARLPMRTSADIAEAIFGTTETELVIAETCQAALMFGSVAPTIAADDVSVLFEKLVRLYTKDGDTSALRQLVREEPLEGSEEHAWEQGYELATDLLDDLALPDLQSDCIDVETLYHQLGIRVEDIALHDTDIRAVAIAGSHHLPAALINVNHDAMQWSSGRRFTLAHELCHLLFDRRYGTTLALASGPWAPRDLERRANAFAAMLLMPPQLIARAVQSLTIELESPEGIATVARHVCTSFTATLEHLCNLGVIDETVRDRIRTEADRRTMAEQSEEAERD
jgi:Zn-dependent peptidase ImmA (M78 family)